MGWLSHKHDHLPAGPVGELLSFFAPGRVAVRAGFQYRDEIK